MQPWERRSFAETAYKRMFWQGYNGGFGLYSWPTEWTDHVIWDSVNYNRSEEKAYWSAWGLRGVLLDLNNDYEGKVNVFGHSMGNIVISEALRIEATSATPDKIVHTYIASQAASVANAYDADERNVPKTETELVTTETPDVYSKYPPTGKPYFEQIGAVADRLVNFYNPEDFALSLQVWMANQDTKPDGGSYDPETATWYWGLVNSTEVTFPSDRYKIFAFLAEAESLPLGRQPNVDGPFEPSMQVDLNAQFGFGGDRDYSHSAQFGATNMHRRHYWRQLLVSFGVAMQQ